jgi:hypothetical protein
MVKHSIPIENISKLVVVSVGGSLYLNGWNQDEIRIKDLPEKDLVTIKKDRVEIHFPGDGFIHIPHHLEVEIQTVGDDAVIKKFNNGMKILTVGGDLTIKDVNNTSAESIGGDLIAKRVQGDLKVENIGGEALIDNVTGQISLRNVGGDIVITDIGGGVEASAGGEGTVDIHPVPWQAYKIEVGGNLSVTLPEESNADLVIKSAAKDISLTIGELDIKSGDNELSQQLGEGGPTVMLSAGGKIFISGDDFSVFTGIKMNIKDFGDFGADFSAQTADQIKISLEDLELDLRESLSGLSDTLEGIGISEENMRNIGIQIEESSKMAAEKAELAAIKAQAKVEKKIAQARRKALKAQAKMKEFDLGDFLETQHEKREVNETERLLILEMLQEKKISLDEADQLLKALEGKK